MMIPTMKALWLVMSFFLASIASIGTSVFAALVDLQKASNKEFISDLGQELEANEKIDVILRNGIKKTFRKINTSRERSTGYWSGEELSGGSALTLVRNTEGALKGSIADIKDLEKGETIIFMSDSNGMTMTFEVELPSEYDSDIRNLQADKHARYLNDAECVDSDTEEFYLSEGEWGIIKSEYCKWISNERRKHRACSVMQGKFGYRAAREVCPVSCDTCYLLHPSAKPSSAPMPGHSLHPPPLKVPPFRPNPKKVGKWETVIPKDNGPTEGSQLGMQTVHNILLPSGKVLIASGSSWRNFQNNTEIYPKKETYPKTKWPGVNTGLFHRKEDPFINSKKASYYEAVNNVGVYDPETNEFFRVPHPLPVDDPDVPDHFIPSDLFCSGQIQLPDGNALFMGGTQYYMPYRTGHNAAYIYDWIRDAREKWEEFDWTVMPDPSKSPWTFAGLMKKARWYPSAVPLMDGRLVIVGGFIGFKDISTTGYGDMYQFEMNTGVDFFDYRKFAKKNPNKAWKHKDTSKIQGSPFTTELLEKTAAATECDGKPKGQQECDSYKFDAFKLYPRAILMPDGRRIFFTRDGDYNSLRTATGKYQRNTNFTYLMDVGTAIDDPITFEYGPELPRYALNSGTVVRDPNNPRHLLITGGMPNYGGNLGPGLLDAADDRCDATSDKFDINLANHYLGSRGSRGLLTYVMPVGRQGIGSWERWDTKFLGASDDSSRTMHYMIILPTRQLLLVGGGNYDFSYGVKTPILFTPKEGSHPIQYSRQKVSNINNARLYHSGALLLADGRVYMAGSNANRASITEEPISRERKDYEGPGQKKFNLKHVDREVYFLGDGRMGKGFKPAPAEDWTAEIYSPPYLFIDGNRRAVITSLDLVSPSPPDPFQFMKRVAGKNHYLFHSKMTIQISMSNLPESCSIDEGSLVLIKLAASTHGWDSGQQLFKIPIKRQISGHVIEFLTPKSDKKQIVPAFYHLFYIDCRGKPTVAQSVRFDDNVDSIDGVAKAV